MVTGATGGIGESLAKSFLESGAEIVITGTTEDRLLALQKKIGNQCKIFRCDLSNNDSVNGLIDFLNDLGGIDILVNNAGKTDDGLFLRMKDQQWEEVMTLNLTSIMRLTRGLLRNMIKKRWGRIINITSVVAMTGNPGQANYVASKAGLIGMSKSLALEVATRGVTVNCIAPGFIQTNMTDKLNESQINEIISKVPLGWIADPEEFVLLLFT